MFDANDSKLPFVLNQKYCEDSLNDFNDSSVNIQQVYCGTKSMFYVKYGELYPYGSNVFVVFVVDDVVSNIYRLNKEKFPLDIESQKLYDKIVLTLKDRNFQGNDLLMKISPNTFEDETAMNHLEVRDLVYVKYSYSGDRVLCYVNYDGNVYDVMYDKVSDCVMF